MYNENVEAISKMFPKELIYKIIQLFILAVKTLYLDLLHRFLNERV